MDAFDETLGASEQARGTARDLARRGTRDSQDFWPSPAPAPATFGTADRRLPDGGPGFYRPRPQSLSAVGGRRGPAGGRAGALVGWARSCAVSPQAEGGRRSLTISCGRARRRHRRRRSCRASGRRVENAGQRHAVRGARRHRPTSPGGLGPRHEIDAADVAASRLRSRRRRRRFPYGVPRCGGEAARARRHSAAVVADARLRRRLGGRRQTRVEGDHRHAELVARRSRRTNRRRSRGCISSRAATDGKCRFSPRAFPRRATPCSSRARPGSKPTASTCRRSSRFRLARRDRQRASARLIVDDQFLNCLEVVGASQTKAILMLQMGDASARAAGDRARHRRRAPPRGSHRGAAPASGHPSRRSAAS